MSKSLVVNNFVIVTARPKRLDGKSSTGFSVPLRLHQNCYSSIVFHCWANKSVSPTTVEKRISKICRCFFSHMKR